MSPGTEMNLQRDATNAGLGELLRQNVSLATLPVMVLSTEGGPGIEERVRAAFRRIQRAAGLDGKCRQ